MVSGGWDFSSSSWGIGETLVLFPGEWDFSSGSWGIRGTLVLVPGRLGRR